MEHPANPRTMPRSCAIRNTCLCQIARWLILGNNLLLFLRWGAEPVGQFVKGPQTNRMVGKQRDVDQIELEGLKLLQQWLLLMPFCLTEGTSILWDHHIDDKILAQDAKRLKPFQQSPQLQHHHRLRHSHSDKLASGWVPNEFTDCAEVAQPPNQHRQRPVGCCSVTDDEL